MPYTLKANINGQAQDVEVAEIPEAVFTQEARTRKYVPSDAFESELSRRAEGIVKNKGYRLPDELVDDQGFVEKVSTKHGLKKADAQSADEAQRLAQRLELERKSWEERHLNPVKQEVEKAAANNKRLIQKGLEKEVLRAAAAIGMKKQFIKDTPGGKPLAVAMFDGRFGYEPEKDEYFARDGDRWAFSPKATNDKPYMTVQEYMEQFASEKDNADYFDSTKQSGPGLNRGGTTDDSAKVGDIVLSPDQASDAQTFQAALAKVNGDFSRIRVAQPVASNPFGG